MDVHTRYGRRPDADEMMILRIILLIITFGSILKDVFEVRITFLGNHFLGLEEYCLLIQGQQILLG